MKCILVTGAAGFIGANFVLYWQRKYPEDRLIALDALTYAGDKKNLKNAFKNSNFEFCHGDILDRKLVESLIRQNNITTIVHFAAESHVDRSITGPDEFIRTNITGTHSLLETARKVWLTPLGKPHRFHHISTDEVYGTLAPDDPPFSEKTPYAPNSPYAASKAASDHLVRAYHKTYGLNTTISNCSNNFGPYQYPEKLIPLVILNILEGKPLPVYGDGRQIRDWLHVEDHISGIDLILNNGKPGQTYNIGANNEKNNLEVVKTVCRIIDQIFSQDPELSLKFSNTPFRKNLESSCLITHVTDRPGHDRRYAIDNTKISRELGYNPTYSFERGITETIKWYLEKFSR